MKAVVFLADGFEEGEALIVVDILRRAGIETVMAAIGEKSDVDSSRNIVVKADAFANDIDFAPVNLVVLPGGRLGTENLRYSGVVRHAIAEFKDHKMIAAICAAPSILAELGLLEGKMATCHPDYEDKMAGTVLTGGSVAVDGNIITGQGLGATFDFAFELVNQMVGAEKVEQIKKAICYKG